MPTYSALALDPEHQRFGYSPRTSQVIAIAAETVRVTSPALAAWLTSESVHAAEAEHLAGRISTEAMTAVSPDYRPATLHALAVAQENTATEEDPCPT